MTKVKKLVKIQWCVFPHCTIYIEWYIFFPVDALTLAHDTWHMTHNILTTCYNIITSVGKASVAPECNKYEIPIENPDFFYLTNTIASKVKGNSNV